MAIFMSENFWKINSTYYMQTSVFSEHDDIDETFLPK